MVEVLEEEELAMMLGGLLPVIIRSGSVFWPSQVVEALKALSKGPDCSHVKSGETLFKAISGMRNSLFTLSANSLAPSTCRGFALFFERQLMAPAESARWFGEIVPALASLLLRFPSLLESHYQNASDDNNYLSAFPALKTCLRLLPSQQPGIVFLTQELIAALLACAFFCLFPVTDRAANNLPMINFDSLFESLHESYSEAQENKIKCMIHYFERIISSMPRGYVSFERKVLPLKDLPLCVSYPKPEFWSKSLTPLCSLEVRSSGFIEDQSSDAHEVDFANKYLGGGALHRGCVQEEIRFMINPELIAGMLFLPCMEDNEAIEIIGAERFSNYEGYASSFRFSGDHVDTRSADSFRRRKTRIVAIDALCSPRMEQYRLKYLLRETNKAFCGFFDQRNYKLCESLFQDNGLQNSDNGSLCLKGNDKIGIATGNWGCGVFGGDPELKTVVQWLAGSQALRPFILYYTCGIKALQNLEKVSRWILSQEWTVGDLWNMLVEYSTQRYKEETDVGFFSWLLPSVVRKVTMEIVNDSNSNPNDYS